MFLFSLTRFSSIKKLVFKGNEQLKMMMKGPREKLQNLVSSWQNFFTERNLSIMNLIFENSTIRILFKTNPNLLENRNFFFRQTEFSLKCWKIFVLNLKSKVCPVILPQFLISTKSFFPEIQLSEKFSQACTWIN